ncbi:hypothetical protein CLPU_6c01650 [Gottschalkia purinilytica]|uniref:DUF1093 domain-containing protein n=1 Tax=Gottschalkia purinilytica TaxID=1503 RepID=A0A0L0WAY1_GOTPU|nr:YxeA family protein [Gottschalkia purinilytica]KNF08679.1 hypothetical protein CLPU_6c01650 [Gottschalkia purinilytica]
MKKYILTISALFMCISLLAGCSNSFKQLINKIANDKYYVKITEEGTLIEDKVKEDKTSISVGYTLVAYDKNGVEKKISFKVGEQLKQNSYLLLYLSDIEGVTSYKKIKEEDLPKKVKEKFNVK